LRQHRAEALAAMSEARKNGDTDNALVPIGQDAGLIYDVPPAGEIAKRIAREAEQIRAQRLPSVMKH